MKARDPGLVWPRELPDAGLTRPAGQVQVNLGAALHFLARHDLRTAIGRLPPGTGLTDWMLASLGSRAIASLSPRGDCQPGVAPPVGDCPARAILPGRFRKLADAAPEDLLVATARRYLVGRRP